MLRFLGALCLSVAAYGAAARPGTINYSEGQVNLDRRAIGAKQLGSAELAAGHVLETSRGKAEILLTPGVFLRLGDNSAVRMISPSLTDTRVELLRGRALLEVDVLEKENRLEVRDRGADVEIRKRGVYAFDADHPQLSVYDGKATARIDDREVEVGKGKEIPLRPSGELKPRKFDRNETDDLMAWSKLRSQHVAQANESSVRTIVLHSPEWWVGTGWYWNPWYSTWALAPGAGYMYNPWRAGFYAYPRPPRIPRGGSGVRFGR